MIQAHPAHAVLDRRRDAEHPQHTLAPDPALALAPQAQPAQRALDRSHVVAIGVLDEAPRDRGERAMDLDERAEQIAPAEPGKRGTIVRSGILSG